MVRVFGMVPFDRSGRVVWMLEECGVPHEWSKLSWRDGDLDAPEFRAISPLGKVPAMQSGDTTLFETPAILDWIGRTHGSESWNPDNQDDGAYRSWLALASGTIDPWCFEFVRPDVRDDDKPARRAQAARDLKRSGFWNVLQARLDAHGSVLPGGLCAVDIQIAASLHYAERGGLLDDKPEIRSWLDAMRARPAAKTSGLFG